MKRYLLLIISLIVTCASFAQSIKSSDLLGSWQLIPENGVVMAGTIVNRFDEGKYTTTIYNSKSETKQEFLVSDYYLSNTPDSIFDQTKVGTKTEGTYLITKNVRVNTVGVSTIALAEDGTLSITATVNQQTAKLKRLSDKQITELNKGVTTDITRKMNSLLDILNAEMGKPTVHLNKAGTLVGALPNLFSSFAPKDIQSLSITGPLNGSDIQVIKLLAEEDDYTPNLKELDLSRAWIVGDTIPYYVHYCDGWDHNRFTGITGIRYQTEFEGKTVDAICDAYGISLEVERDSKYIHHCTTIDDCICEYMFAGMKNIETLHLPITTREIHWNSIAWCPKLKEITLPPYVNFVSHGAFTQDSSLHVVRVREGAPLLKAPQLDPNNQDKTAFWQCPKDLRIETFKLIPDDVTFTVRGKRDNRVRHSVSDYTNHRTTLNERTLQPDFSFPLTVPKGALIGFHNTNDAFIADGKDVYIDLVKHTISGSAINKELNSIRQQMRKKIAEFGSMRTKIAYSTDSISIIKLKAQMDTLQKVIDGIATDALLEHRDDVIPEVLLTQYYDELSNDAVSAILCALNEEHAMSPLLSNVWQWHEETTREKYIDVRALSDTAYMKSVHVERPGTLRKQFTDEQWYKGTRWKIVGKINRTDLKWLKNLCAKRFDETTNKAGVDALDLTEAVIVDAKGNVSTVLPDSAFSFTNKLRYIALPRNIEAIGVAAFLDCNCLESIVLPSSLKRISQSAFRLAVRLKKIDMPEKLSTIGKQAFYDCDRIRLMSLPASVVSIGDEAFARCDNLSLLSIPAATTSIGKDVVRTTPNVKIAISADNRNYKVIANHIIRK